MRRYKVAKNRLATLALDGTRFEAHRAAAEGSDRACVVDGSGGGGEDRRRVRQDNDKFVSWAARSAPRRWTPHGVKALAELPSLETLRAQLLGLIQTPATRIAGVLQAPAGQLARVFGAYAKKDEARRRRPQESRRP